MLEYFLWNLLCIHPFLLKAALSLAGWSVHVVKVHVHVASRVIITPLAFPASQRIVMDRYIFEIRSEMLCCDKEFLFGI